LCLGVGSNAKPYLEALENVEIDQRAQLDKLLEVGLFMKRFLRDIVIFAVPAALISQQPTSSLNQSSPGTADSTATQEIESYTFKVNSQLVLLDTVVRDRSRNAVRHLTRDDFTILEDGVSRPIAAFEAVDTTIPTLARPIVSSTEELENTFPNSPVTILVLDELTTNFEDEYFARYSLGRYLDAQGKTLNEPTMLLARTYGRTMVLHDYTTSRQDILDALDRHLVGNDWRAQTPNQAGNLFGAAFASLVEVAKATEGHAGHKNVIWIGRGFPTIKWDNLTSDQAGALDAAVISCSNLLREARITLYSLDPAGISVPEEGTVDASGAVTQADPFASQIDFDTIVRSTGGVSMHGRNDVDRMIAEAVSDGEVFYSLAYKPATTSDYDPKKFHQIKIVMKDSQMSATTREGYYLRSAEASAAKQESDDVSDAPALDLAGAINGMIVYSGIPLQVTRREQSNKYQVSFPAAPVDLKEANGRLTGQVDLIVLSFDRSGKVLSRSGQVITLRMSTLPPDKTENRKVMITTTVDNTGNLARIRFVVRAHATGRIGAENFFLIDRSSLQDPSTGLRAKSQPK
jgi:VWFA-related protein